MCVVSSTPSPCRLRMLPGCCVCDTSIHPNIEGLCKQAHKMYVCNKRIIESNNQHKDREQKSGERAEAECSIGEIGGKNGLMQSIV